MEQMECSSEVIIGLLSRRYRTMPHYTLAGHTRPRKKRAEAQK
jgi:hypothetical protein